MKILINDSLENKDRIVNIFNSAGYESNNLIFTHSNQECKVFFENYLEKGAELDLIISGNNENGSINALEILLLKNSINTSFSNGNFRINSLPFILYSDTDDKSELKGLGFDAIVKSNNKNKHTYFIGVVEEHIRKWREKLLIDMEAIGISVKKYPYFKSEYEEKRYFKNIGCKSEQVFFNKTSVLSKEFIANPVYLKYDWLTVKQSELERSVVGFGKMFRNHIKYDRKNNERTIIHDFLLANKIILERDVYCSHLYEMPLREENKKNSQICDFILQASLPDYQNTTFFEVKKEDVQLMIKKKKKRPQPSHDFHSHLYQLSNYQSYAGADNNSGELFAKIGYSTQNFSYQLLAGRSDEKEEVEEVLGSILAKNFSGIELITFEEFENLNYSYIEKLSRLNF